MQRRSSNRKSRKRYTIDAFEGIEELRDESPLKDDAAEAEAGDKYAAQVDDDARVDEDEHEDEQDVDIDVDASVASDDNDLDLDDDIPAEDDADDSTERTPSRISATPSKSTRKKRGPNQNSRGVVQGSQLHTQKNKKMQRLSYFGPTLEDYGGVRRAEVKWAFEPVLPSRTADDRGFGGFHFPFHHDEEGRHQVIAESWQWYLERGGQEAFTERQKTTSLAVHDTAEYLPTDTKESCFLLGSVNSPRRFNIPVRESIPLADGFQTGTGNGRRSGYILNLGAKIQHLEWLADHDSPLQYLAVSILPERESEYPPFEAPSARAFTPQPRYKTSIQIWRFHLEDRDHPRADLKPTLSSLICTSWGDVKAFRVCPMTIGYVAQSQKRGLLAGIWADGGMRVIQMPGGEISHDEVESIHIDKSAIESHPPETVFTCVTWVSPNRIAAGCANGFVAIYNIETALNANTANARPDSYSAIATTYMLAMTTCYPSHPQMLFTSAMDGYVRLTDMSQPSMASPAATVLASRTRSGLPRLAWHDYCKGGIAVDENYTIRIHPIRRIFNSFLIGRCKSTATSLAVSHCHPFVLAGSTSGEVTSRNPIRKIMSPKTKVWHQTWFAHEWRRPTERESISEDANDRLIAKTGLARFTEGYKVETVLLSAGESAASSAGDASVTSTVYEKKSAVTALAWNPNIHVGGWAAAGMGDGLIRVEDISLPGPEDD